MPKKPTKVPVSTEEETDDVETPPPAAKKVDSIVEAPKPMVVKSSTTKKKAMPTWVWYVIVGVVVLVAAAFLGWKLFGKSTTNTTTNTAGNVNATNTNTTNALVPRVLDGVLVAADKAFTNVYAVVIENMVDSRPPSGLDKASVVYETLAEGGITRFLALFPVGQEVKQIGPVRSARPYFVSWAEEYKPLFVHAGGSPQALDYLKTGKANVYDFNQFSHGGNFIRDDSRSAPHNLYTDADKLYSGLRNSPGRDVAPTYTSWKFKDELPLDQRVSPAKDIVVNFSSFSYKVNYTFDRVQNVYLRSVGEKAHVTRDGVQLAPKNVIVEFTKVGLLPNEKQRLDITTTGSGKLLLFRDGTVTEGTWKKDTATARTRFLDASGNDLALNAGQIWIDVVPNDTVVTY